MPSPFFFPIRTTLAFLPLVLLATACQPKVEQRVLPDPAVSVTKVQNATLSGDFSASGRLVPREDVAVASELSGYRIARVLVEEDAAVRTGQVLAQLDDTLLRSQIAQARATLAQQKVAADRAKQEAGRVDGLDNQGVLSQEAIMERRLAARSSNAAVDVARAQLDDLLIRSKRLIIRAPKNGRVLERTARPGDTSAAGAVLFRIARDDLVELHAEVPEAAMDNIAVGDPVRVALASGAILSGSVRLRGARVNDQTGLAIVRVALPVNSALRPGGFAKAQFTRSRVAVRAVPERAIIFDANGASVFVVDAKRHVHRDAVKTGRRAGGLVELVDGPPAGATIVLGGGAFLLEGDKIRLAQGSAK